MAIEGDTSVSLASFEAGTTNRVFCALLETRETGIDSTTFHVLDNHIRLRYGYAS